MVTVAYTISEKLKEQLSQIELLRQEILTFPFSPKTLIRLKFEAAASEIYHSLSLTQTDVSKNDVVLILSRHDISQKKLNSETTEIFTYRKGLEYIEKEWKSQKKSVTANDCITLFEISCKGSLTSDNQIAEIKHILDYVQVSREHPIVQAGLILVLMLKQSPITQNNARFSRLLSNLFLYKAGYDVEGLLVVEDYFFEHEDEYKKELNLALTKDSQTAWLEYFAESVVKQLKNTKKIAEEGSTLFRTLLPQSFWKLSDRQKELLALSDIPNAKLTNKKVQNLYHVSQITASRDLAKLSLLGLLAPSGRGRSIYYTRF